MQVKYQCLKCQNLLLVDLKRGFNFICNCGNTSFKKKRLIRMENNCGA